MSRFYALHLHEIKVQNVGVPVSMPSNPNSAATPAYAIGNAPDQVITSHPGNPPQYDPSAQNVIFDIPVADYSIPTGAYVVTVEGVGFPAQPPPHATKTQLATLATNWGMRLDLKGQYRGWFLKLYGGMTKAGLPLSTTQPSPGLIVQGYVLEGFGVWVGNEMAINFVIAGEPYSNDKPGNLTLTWKHGMQLGAAMQQMFQTAYPNYVLKMNISPNLVNTHDVIHFTKTLAQLGAWLTQHTKGVLGPLYPGVKVAIQQGKILVWDETYATPTVTQLLYTDLIGEPTWVDGDTLQVVVVLRHDLALGEMIEMPKQLKDLPGMARTIPDQHNAFQNYQLTFEGKFWITAIRHLGDFRADNGAYWVTIIRCVGVLNAPVG